MKERRQQTDTGLEKNGVERVFIRRRVIQLIDFSNSGFVRVVFANKEELLIKKGTEIIFKNRHTIIRNIKL